MAYDARLDDFLGEGGTNDLPSAPDLTEDERKLAAAAASKRARDAALAELPYGTPISQGGTAQGYQVTTQHDDVGLGTTSVRARTGDVAPGDNPGAIGAFLADGGYTDGTYDKAGNLIGNSHHLDSPTDPNGTVLKSPTGQAAVDGGQSALDDAEARSEAGTEGRKNALQDVIDRFNAAGNIDTTQQDESRAVQQEALSQNRQLFAKANSFDPKAAAAQYSEESLSKALAIARSAPGGKSRETALFNALESAPALAAEGQRQANAEGRSQQNVALQAAGQLGQLATGTRGQDEQQAEAYTGIGLDVAKQIANATGLNLQLDARDKEFLGEVALQVANLDLDVEKLGVDESLRRLELQLQKEGLAQEWRQFKDSQKITGKDVLGGIFGLGGSAISGYFTGLAAKAAKGS